VKRRLSREIETRGCSSLTSIRNGTERGSRILPAAGGCNTKKSFARTLAVICEGAEGTQDVSSLPGIRGTRFAKTITSEKTQTQTTAKRMQVRRPGRGIRSDSIWTPPSEDFSSIPFYTRGVERESRSRSN
jgi:hypothetical protein